MITAVFVFIDNLDWWSKVLFATMMMLCLMIFSLLNFGGRLRSTQRSRSILNHCCLHKLLVMLIAIGTRRCYLDSVRALLSILVHPAYFPLLSYWIQLRFVTLESFTKLSLCGSCFFRSCVDPCTALFWIGCIGDTSRNTITSCFLAWSFEHILLLHVVYVRVRLLRIGWLTIAWRMGLSVRSFVSRPWLFHWYMLDFDTYFVLRISVDL